MSDKGDTGTPCHFAVGEHREGLLLLLQSSRWNVWRICFGGHDARVMGAARMNPAGWWGCTGGTGRGWPGSPPHARMTDSVSVPGV